MISVWPRTLKAQAVLILTSLFIVSHAASLFIFDRSRYKSIIMTEATDLADRVAGIVLLAHSFSATDRQEILLAAEKQFLTMFPDVVPINQAACQHNRFSERISQRLDAAFEQLPALGKRVCVRSLDSPLFFNSGHPEEGFDVMVAITFPDGEEILFHALLPPPTPLIQDVTLVILLAVGLGALVLAWALILRITGPIQRLAQAAERVGTDIDAPPLEETGPMEAQVAAGAFNGMQERLARLLHGQTEMLAAISHDLRTALTRLQLRAEMVQDKDQREGILRVVNDMFQMVQAVIAFVRGHSPDEPARTTDIGSLVESLCDDLAEEGAPVTCNVEAEGCLVRCRPAALRRALQNVMENAVTYGGSARVKVSADAEYALVAVEDQGPGIPEQAMETVLQPFQRLKRSRSHQTGGIGLGLSITQNIVRAHGGTLQLTNRAEGGLRVEIKLSRQRP